jgi:nitrate reductase NapE component
MLPKPFHVKPLRYPVNASYNNSHVPSSNAIIVIMIMTIMVIIASCALLPLSTRAFVFAFGFIVRFHVHLGLFRSPTRGKHSPTQPRCPNFQGRGRQNPPAVQLTGAQCPHQHELPNLADDVDVAVVEGDGMRVEKRGELTGLLVVHWPWGRSAGRRL